ncbi:MAG: hypothetical protein PHS79_02485 [Patescibacteria group bacterium]|nr:hypothetical protein [Patescibacteria group bacterium]
MPTKFPRKKTAPKPELGMILELGKTIKLTLNAERSTSYVVCGAISLDGFVANFQEALDVPHESYLLKDFCAEDFFKRKTGLSSDQAYKKMQEGHAEINELFVEYGQHIGALIANLELLFKPTSIAIKGAMTKSYDAWSHAMGKARNQHLGKKPTVKIAISSSRSTS